MLKPPQFYRPGARQAVPSGSGTRLLDAPLWRYMYEASLLHSTDLSRDRTWPPIGAPKGVPLRCPASHGA